MDGFKFELGDIVVTTMAVYESLAALACGEARSPMVFAVCERLQQECPGGVQRHYKLVNAAGHDVTMLDILVVSADPAKPDALYQRYLDERKAARERQSQAIWRDPANS